jgi:two-component system sensor histidine kinase UhpB
MELPRLVMRRALAVALGCLAVSLALGLLHVRRDTRQEMAGSLALARASLALAELAGPDPAPALDALRTLEGLRHVRLSLLDVQGRALLQQPPDAAAPAGGAWRAVRGVLGLAAAAPPVTWRVPDAAGGAWTVMLTASPDSELQEALADFAGLFLGLAACSLLLLGVMHWNVRRALAPLQSLLRAIAHVERQDPAAVRALPAMPVRELEAIAQALRHLAAVQERTESARRVLGDRLLSLQEDERQRLARDLHDEFGQRLTGLRVDATWLRRRLTAAPEQQAVAAGMAEQVGRIQDDLRRLLARLRPFAPSLHGGAAAPETLGRLRLMLEDLVAGWSAPASRRPTQVELQWHAGPDGRPLPQELALGVYRISQEALTNVARHAGARHATLAIGVETDANGSTVLAWSVRDDGCGVADLEAALQRGSGLAGVKDRVWALGGEFEASSGASPGLSLQARLPLPGEGEGDGNDDREAA